jgi:hypothetical protein
MEESEHPALPGNRASNEILVICGDEPEAMAFRPAEAAGLAERTRPWSGDRSCGTRRMMYTDMGGRKALRKFAMGVSCPS